MSLPNLKLLKEEVGKYYKREFILWLLGGIGLTLALFLVVWQGKKYLILKESFERFNTSFSKMQSEIRNLKQELPKINWSREFKKEMVELNLEVDLRDLNGALRTVRGLVDPAEDKFFDLKTMKLKADNASVVMMINGQSILFR